MYSPLLVSTLLLCGAVLSAAEGDIEDLEYTTYNTTIKNNPMIFVLFYYAPDGRKLLGAYERAVSQLRQEGFTTVKFAKVDSNSARQLCSVVKGVAGDYIRPALFYYKNNRLLASKKDGYWTSDILVQWMKETKKTLF